jgi:hypothetical protein
MKKISKIEMKKVRGGAPVKGPGKEEIKCSSNYKCLNGTGPCTLTESGCMCGGKTCAVE